ncbi:MAG: hypothetical protein Q8O16_00415 [Dehalococcoidia bacterium]|nr:hypothetical protein [Dehalococcoidia bacterium]
MRLAVTVILPVIMLGSLAPALPVLADDEVKWMRVNIPANGSAGNWQLADGSDVRHLTRAADGTLYSYANPAGTTQRLFKSSDGGYSWSYTGKIEEDLVDIGVVPDKPNMVYCATTAKIYKSVDAGVNFTLLGVNPGGAGAGNVEITSIDVRYVEGNGTVIAAGTRDTDAGQFGGVYILEENKSLVWVDTGIGGYDVCTVSFSPTYAHDRQLIAVATDETNTIVTANFNRTGWNTVVGDARIPGVVAVSAAIAFPAGYSSEAVNNSYVQFVAIDTGTGNGDVYRIDGKPAPAASKVTDMNAGTISGLNSIDVTGLSVTGSADKAVIMAGASASAQVYLSVDGGKNWTVSAKPPTGAGKTCVLLTPDFNDSGMAYAATSGAESAFSVTRNKGVIWNQAGLIDTKMTAIVDFAVSPDYSQDNTLFLLTFGGKHSLWRSVDGAVRWERVYSGALPGVDTMSLVALSPQFTRSRVMFVAGTSGGNPVVWRSTDNGQSFIRFSSRDPNTSNALTIGAWAVAPDDSLIVGSYDGTNGVICRTASGGLFYISRATAGTASLNHMALSPGFSKDKTVLTGTSAGWVYLSSDGGLTFQALPPDAAAAPIGGLVYVAFDSDYSRNKTVYAASDTAGKGIYRFVVGKSTEWEKIDVTLPAGSKITGMTVSADGVLYASNSLAVDAANKKGGMERSLDPTYSLGPSFETVTRGLPDGATLKRICVAGNRLWSMELTGVKLMTFVDSHATPVKPVAPADKAPGLDTTNVTLEWESVKGATGYKWQLDHETDFSSIPTGFEGNIQGTSVRLPALESDTTYYWRVRATEPVLSPWSAKRSFSTVLGTEVIAPKLTTPESAASRVPLKPVFQWSAIAGADRYELVVSVNVTFANPVVARMNGEALPATAWQCDVTLRYNTTYYWKVRALNAATRSAWSAAGAFITELPPEPSTAPPAPTTIVIPVPMLSPQSPQPQQSQLPLPPPPP